MLGRNEGAERVRGACGWHRSDIAARPETSTTASARRRETPSGPNAHGCTSAGCTSSQSCLAARRTPGRAAHHGPGGPRWATPPAGDLNHALVQLDESAIAGNVGRDLAFTASRLAARSHPAAGRCGRLCSLVMFGISHSNAFERSTVGCSRPPGKRCSLCARIRHDRAHICREDDGRGTSRSHATLRLQRAADARHRVANRTASWLARAHLGLDCHEFPSVFSPACARDRLIGAAAARCAVPFRRGRALRHQHGASAAHRDRPPMQPHHRKAPITHAAPPAPRRVQAGPPTRPRRPRHARSAPRSLGSLLNTRHAQRSRAWQAWNDHHTWVRDTTGRTRPGAKAPASAPPDQRAARPDPRLRPGCVGWEGKR